MAFLLTDVGEYRALTCPAKFTFGRATENDFRPDSQSVSKRHAVLETSFIPGTEKIEVFIEDLKSTNGTFVGESPLDFEHVSGKRKIPFGTYIRFGFSQKYFRLVDRITDSSVEEVLILSSSGTSKTNIKYDSNKVVASPAQLYFVQESTTSGGGGAAGGIERNEGVEPHQQFKLTTSNNNNNNNNNNSHEDRSNHDQS